MPGIDTLAAANAWRSWLEASFSDKTASLYWRTLFAFLRRTGASLSEITEDHVARWLAEQPYRSSARRTYYQALKSFFDFCHRRGYVDSNPIAGIRVPAAVEKVPTALSAEEVDRLVSAAEERGGMRPWSILLIYYTGARLHEAVTMEWNDVHNGQLHIEHAKGGRERAVPISRALRKTLDALADFSGPNGRILPRSGGTVWGWVRDAGRDAGIHAYPHLLRSTFATQMLVRGAKPHTVRELLGHRNIRTTMRYWAVTDEDRRDAVELL